MFELDSSLGDQIFGITKDTFSGVSGFVIFLIGLVLGFLILTILTNWFRREREI